MAFIKWRHIQYDIFKLRRVSLKDQNIETYSSSERLQGNIYFVRASVVEISKRFSSRYSHKVVFREITTRRILI